MTRGPRLVILGKQGAGKGTQAARIAQHYGILHLATGDLLRDAAEARTDAGVEAKRYMDAGDLVPDEIVFGVLQERLDQPGARQSGFVLDGFPRNAAQARELEAIVADDPLDVVVNLDVPTDVVLDRIAGRKRAEGRDDDHDAAIARRLELYERETSPLVGFYTDRGLLVEVDGLGEPDDVFKRLVAAIDERMP